MALLRMQTSIGVSQAFKNSKKAKSKDKSDALKVTRGSTTTQIPVPKSKYNNLDVKEDPRIGYIKKIPKSTNNVIKMMSGSTEREHSLKSSLRFKNGTSRTRNNHSSVTPGAK